MVSPALVWHLQEVRVGDRRTQERPTLDLGRAGVHTSPVHLGLPGELVRETSTIDSRGLDCALRTKSPKLGGTGPELHFEQIILLQKEPSARCRLRAEDFSE